MNDWTVPIRWAKRNLEAMTNLTEGALHVHIGLLLFLIGIWLFGTGRWRVIAILAGIGVLTLINEVADYLITMHIGYKYSVLNGVRDIANTMSWPIAFSVFGPTFMSRLKKSRLRRKTSQRPWPAAGVPTPDRQVAR